MKPYKLYQVDAFTKQKFQGNPAGVVPFADGLKDDQMQSIAREMNCSETAFVFSSKIPEYDVHVRYFTPSVEVPICGHATIAAHYVRARVSDLPSTRVLAKTGAGILPIDIVRERNDFKIVMTQGRINFGPIITGVNRENLIEALSLNTNDIDSRCPIQIVSTGHSKVMICIKSRMSLNQLLPDLKSLDDLSKQIGCNGYFIFTFDSNEPNILTCGRMFAPAIGINEDPVTGNAHGPLGAYLVHYCLVPHNGEALHFYGKQGESIKRTGYVEVTVQIQKKETVQVQIAGSAVIVFETEIEL